MCDKKEFEALKEAVGAVKHDTGNIRNSQKGIFEQLKNINGRVGKAEKKINDLEDPRLRAFECIQKDAIIEMRENMSGLLTIKRFEKYLDDEKAADVLSEQMSMDALLNKQQRMQWMVAAIVGVGMIAVTLITILV